MAIDGCEEVAQIGSKSVYVITSVATIPLRSFDEAEKAIQEAKSSSISPGPAAAAKDDAGGSDDDEERLAERSKKAAEEDADLTTPAKDQFSPGLNPASSVAQDVIGRRGQYGRFTERWFSKNGWIPERRKVQNAAASTLKIVSPFKRAADQVTSSQSDADPADPGDQASHVTPEVAVSLLPKLLRTLTFMLCSKSFFFSYDIDITRRLGTQLRKDSGLPLHKVVDPVFFWNRYLSTELIEAGMNSFVLPIMQGFVGQRAFVVPRNSAEAGATPVEKDSVKPTGAEDSKPAKDASEASDSPMEFKMTLISRRSVKRPGLRYLRRGIDEEGNTANTVETEQVLSTAFDKHKSGNLSFIQFRGSIPLYFSQSPYSFKPAPVVHHSSDVNHAAFKRHFKSVRDRYGKVQVILLVDKGGVEAPIGVEYQKHMQSLNYESGVKDGPKIAFEWFDFHGECRGMNFQNVAILIDTLEPIVNAFGYTVEEEGKIRAQQSGLCRTNCMDCLDRTNVVQSALGRHVLRKQFEDLGVSIDLQFGEHSKWFNTLWADNGDAISKQYASTAALKGDYTRTSKRNYQGALNDFSLNVSRYYSGIVNDYFSQAVIDYLLGNVTDLVFEEFQANLMSHDPGMSVSKIRQNAIDVSVKIVIEDKAEDLRCGWVVLTPSHPNTLRTLPLEEVVLLITNQALYAVRFDWSTEKVNSFERVALESIVGVQRGTYITSTFANTDTDARRNVGFVVQYKPGSANIARVNTRSMSTSVDPMDDPASLQSAATKKNRGDTVQFLAFKAPADRSAVTGKSGARADAPPISETVLVENICEELARAGRLGEVEGKDIISLEEAKKSVGLLEQWSNSLKRYIWA